MKQNEISLDEKFKLITECRQSGQPDNQWCMEHSICRSTFYRWIREIRSKNNSLIPTQQGLRRSAAKQEVVRVNIVPETIEEEPAMNLSGTRLPNDIERSTIEIMLNNAQVRVSNTADPKLLAAVLRMLGESVC